MPHTHIANADPCELHQCEAHERCVLNEHNNTECVCGDECPRPQGNEWVCGTDGKSYPSRCHVKLRACQNSTPFLQPSYAGKCNPGNYTSVVASECYVLAVDDIFHPLLFLSAASAFKVAAGKKSDRPPSVITCRSHSLWQPLPNYRVLPSISIVG